MRLKHAILTAVTVFGPLLFTLPRVAPADDAAGAEVTSTSSEEETKTSSPITFEKPLLITDVGQGNSSKLVEALLKRAGDFEFTSESTASAAKLEGMKTLIIGVGASSKGLGAAGLNADEEYERATKLLAAAKEMNIPVIGVHIGGVPRRGELSDRFNKLVFEKSTVFIAWAGGNEDDFFTNLAKETDVPLIIAEDKRAVGDKLTMLLSDGFAPPEKKAEVTSEKKPETEQQDKAE